MHNEIIVTISYKDIKLEYCIYENETFYIGRYLLDTRQYDVGLTIVKTRNVTKIVFSSACDLKIYKIFKETNIEIELLDKKHFYAKNKYDDEMSYGCLNALIYHIEIHVLKCHIGYFNISNYKSLQIGTVGNYKVYRDNITMFLYMDYRTIEDLDLKNNLFKKINFTKTSYGKKQLMKYLIFPYKREYEILNRQKNISDIMNVIITPYLSKIKGLERDGIIDIYKLPKILENVLSIGNILKNTSLSFPEIEQIKKIYELVNIFEGKELRKKLFPKFDQLLNLYTNLPIYLGEIAKNITQGLNDTINIVYIPQLGYLIELDKNADNSNLLFDIRNEYIKNKQQKKSEIFEESLFSSKTVDNKYKTYKKYFESRVEDISQIVDDCTVKEFFEQSHVNAQSYTIDGNYYKSADITTKNCKTSTVINTFESKFLINDKIYVKTKVMDLLDHELGDINNLIEEFKHLKLKDIRELILKHPLDVVYDYIGKVDAVNSLKCFSLDYKCCVPRITKEKRIRIKNIWEYKCDVDFDQNIIYYGSDKFLNLIGEIAILFHMGSHIPALSAQMCIFEEIYTSINVKESILNDTSYFYASLKSISRMINHSTPNSLCLISNLGSGTSQEIGIKLYKKLHQMIKNAFIISCCDLPHVFTHSINRNKTENVTSSDYIIPDIPHEETFELKKDSILHNRMSSIYFSTSLSNQCNNCLCLDYKFYNILFDTSNIHISVLHDTKRVYENDSFLNKIPENFNQLYKESLDIIEKGHRLEFTEKENLWAIHVINEFFKKHNINISKL